jgi:cell division protein FtsB
MASQRASGRSSSGRRRAAPAKAKRRPAARRARPAARRGPSRIKWDKVGRVALTLVLAAVLYSYLNPAIDFVKTYTGTTAAKADFHQLLKENKHLHKRIQSSSDPAVIEQYAREQGLVAEGERPIRLSGLRR